MQVGFIGTGSIGTPMAINLNEDYPLIVHDVTREKATALLENGAQWAVSPKELAAQCDVIHTCLPGPKESTEVVLGEDGIIAGVKKGSVYIDHTTNSPELVREIAAKLEQQGVEMLDAPVSGGTEGAQLKQLLLMVGGKESTYKKYKDVLSSMGDVLYTGDIGNGMISKITHNCATFCVSVAMMENWSVAIKAGLAPEKIVEVFQRAGIGRNMDVHSRLPNTLFQGKFDPIFALDIAKKDISLATDLAKSYGVPVRVSELVLQEYIEAVNRGWGKFDSSVVLTLQEERSGVQVRVPQK